MNLPPLDLGQLAGQAQARPGVLAAVGLVAVGYLVGAWRVPGWRAGRTAAFLGGLVVVVVATCSGIEAYGHVLEWMHMIEHLLLIMVAPALLAIGSPLQLIAEALPPRAATAWRALLERPVVGWLVSPPFAAAFYAICVIGVHLTGLMDRAMTMTVICSVSLGSGYRIADQGLQLPRAQHPAAQIIQPHALPQVEQSLHGGLSGSLGHIRSLHSSSILPATAAAPSRPTFGFMITCTGIRESSSDIRPLSRKAVRNGPSLSRSTIRGAMPPAR